MAFVASPSRAAESIGSMLMLVGVVLLALLGRQRAEQREGVQPLHHLGHAQHPAAHQPVGVVAVTQRQGAPILPDGLGELLSRVAAAGSRIAALMLARQRMLESALEAGHDVRILVRSPEKVTARSPHLSVTEGDACDAAAVDGVVAGTDAVLSALGGFRGPTTSDASCHSATRSRGCVHSRATLSAARWIESALTNPPYEDGLRAGIPGFWSVTQTREAARHHLEARAQAAVLPPGQPGLRRTAQRD